MFLLKKDMIRKNVVKNSSKKVSVKQTLMN